ncbi:MAG: deoxyribodipyrimidine photo-lyase, partial [Actinomycetales bacterium]
MFHDVPTPRVTTKMEAVTTSVMWFRADLRLADQPALRAAVEAGPDGVVPLFVLDDHFWGERRTVRQAALVRILADFDERIGGLHVVHGDPAVEVPRVVKAAGASSVHVTAAPTPYGTRRDGAVEEALAALDVPLVQTGSAYAVTPGRVTKGDGTHYRVFTPFFGAWKEHGWRAPAAPAESVAWIRPEGRTHRIPEVEVPDGVTLPPLGEEAARARWREWIDQVGEYDDVRNLPGRDETSRMSTHLKWGSIHPRTLLADLAPLRSKGADAYARELAFREFYADVLHHRPDSAFGYYDKRFEAMEYDEPGDDLTAWKEGRTGFPIVDAGMRQLLAEGWMHNRVRMIVASFLVKDLHLEWMHGAAHFLERLVDGDLASNQHGWRAPAAPAESVAWIRPEGRTHRIP